MPPHLAYFCIFNRDGVSPFGQAGLELLTLGNLPAWPSQSSGIAGVSHGSQSLIFLKKTIGSGSITQAEVQWCHHSSRQPGIPGLKQFYQTAGITGTCHQVQLVFFIFCRDRSLTMLPKLVSYSWPQDIILPQRPQALGLQV